MASKLPFYLCFSKLKFSNQKPSQESVSIMIIQIVMKYFNICFCHEFTHELCVWPNIPHYMSYAILKKNLAAVLIITINNNMDILKKVWLPARWASGFSDDHQQDHQCLWFLSCCNVTHVFCPHCLYCVGNKITTTTKNWFGYSCCSTLNPIITLSDISLYIYIYSTAMAKKDKRWDV